jgi:hypothetical protein
MLETAQALGLAQAYDNRTVGEVNVRAWHAILGDCDAADVMEAIRRHYAVETTWIMPAHIRLSVGVMVSERKNAERRTGWAPGQAGVPKDQAMPEITGGEDPGWFAGAIQQAASTSAAEILAEIRRNLPEGSREALMPRRVAWEREHRAYLRTRDPEPNPHYRPTPSYTCDSNDVT